jgi:uncharacterized protein
LRVTFDTNVLVSAFIARNGICADILDLVSTFEEIKLVVSREILSEFAEVMKREEVRSRLGYNDTEVVQFEGAVRDVAELVKVTSNFKAIKDDPDDDIVVNAAIDGKAQYIVSGDKHLNKLRTVRGVRVVRPRAFLGIVTKRFGDLILTKNDLVP